jgi:thiamine biosynthesis lipoprotein
VIERHGFRAMGTDIELLLEAERGPRVTRAFAWAEQELERLDAIMSRFRPQSELSRLNAEGELDASPDLLRVVGLALEARERTGGRFDPTVHDALVAAGYDTTFELVPANGPATTPGAACGGRIEIEDERIRLGEGVRLDLGGIGKGYAVDRAAELLATAGPCLVDAGGDVAVRGVPADGVWPVGVETPDGTITLGLERGALATSGRDRRRWRSGGEERHHLIDPSTGRPAESDLLRATVVADDAADAEVWAKVLFLAGSEAARREAEALGLPSVLVTEDGSMITTGSLT